MTSSTLLGSSKSVLQGTPVVPGIATGPAIRPGERLTAQVDGADVDEADRPAELESFRAATAAVAGRLRDRAAHAHGAAAEVLAANAGMVEDRGWQGAAEKLISSGRPAVAAAAAATDQFVDLFQKLGGLMAERVTDLRDVRDRVIAELSGAPEPGIPTPDVPSILLADDLAPADTAGLDPTLIVGLATSLGGPTSHTAIIARQLGIPCVVAVKGLDDVPAGAQVLVDGSAGEVALDPDPEAAAAARGGLQGGRGPHRGLDRAGRHRRRARRRRAGQRAGRRGCAQGGRDPGRWASACSAPSCASSTVTPSRRWTSRPRSTRRCSTPFRARRSCSAPWMQARTSRWPSRTIPTKPNPALGVRGVRIAFGNPGLLDRQLDAVVAAAADAERKPWVMAPMIATAGEAEWFAARVRERGLIPGVMIEVPAAALLADKVLEHVEFLSIGTNDLAQYTMATDRMSSDLAQLTDPWQPAVLSLVARTAAAGAAVNKPVGVCGEAAADPLLACVLVGFGITSLSAAASAVSGVGARLASVNLADCQRAAEAVLSTSNPDAARAAAREVLG